MNKRITWAILALISGAAYGQVPPTNDTSDANNNTGMGSSALHSLTTGNSNTAAGSLALTFDTTGSNNTAVGVQALEGDTSGSQNTAAGYQALASNTTGGNNSGYGFSVLVFNTTGFYNAAFGSLALLNNTTGSYNTATGAGALELNQIGSNNVATGYQALYSNTTGVQNTAFGMNTLYAAIGSNNIAVGYEAGFNITSGSSNIDIGHEGLATDNGFIRIGTAGSQKGAFIAGISSSKVTGSAVYVTTNGRLGVLASSERYKTAIEPIGANSSKLEKLRPVTFKLKTDAEGTVQYGLIAEEVAKVYPELVIRDENGRIDGVRYEELAPMLLNEIQKQAAEIRGLKQQEQQKLAAQDARIRSLEQQVVGLIKVQGEDQLVAQR